MEIEVIQHHRNKAKTVITNTLHANGIQPTESLVEEFLSFYDYNDLSATINNIYRYSRTIRHAHQEEPYLQLVSRR